MNTRHVIALAAAAALLGALPATAAQDGKTPSQTATLQLADQIAGVEGGLTYRDLHPHRFPAVVGQTRAEVRAELAAAIRNGDMVADFETGRTERQLYPQRFAAVDGAPADQVRSRADVRADLAEAIRTGNIVADFESGQTYRELFPQQYPSAAPVQRAAGLTPAS